MWLWTNNRVRLWAIGAALPTPLGSDPSATLRFGRNEGAGSWLVRVEFLGAGHRYLRVDEHRLCPGSGTSRRVDGCPYVSVESGWLVGR